MHVGGQEGVKGQEAVPLIGSLCHESPGPTFYRIDSGMFTTLWFGEL
jgi:hypothetical protein